ncbi:MAG: threonine/serine ThrE exporter family protein [Pseudonocardiaceae bacterium]
MRGPRTGKAAPGEPTFDGWATVELDRRAILHGPPVVDDATVHLVVDLALRIGDLQLAGGAGAADVTATMHAVTEAYSLPQCDVDVIFTSITVSCRRGVEASPVTTTRVVQFRSLDYTRLAALDHLVLRIVRRQLTASQAYTELDALIGGDRTYPRWVATLSWAGMAASLAVLFSAGFGSRVVFGAVFALALLAAVVTALVDRIGRVLNRRSLPFFFQQVVGAGVVTTVSVELQAHAGKYLPHGLTTALLLAAGLTVLLSGFSVVSTVQDAITGFYVTAAGRAFEVALMTTGLVVGVVLVLQATAGDNGGPAVPIPPAFPAPQLDRMEVLVPAAALAAAFFALASYAPPRALLGAGLAGAVSFGAYGLAIAASIGPTGASGLAAIIVGFMGRVVSRRLRLPPLVLAVAGITPLLPGLSTYRGVLELTVYKNPTGLITLLSAASIALALAAGVVLGEFLAQPVRKGLSRLERRLAHPRLIGPMEE